MVSWDHKWTETILRWSVHTSLTLWNEIVLFATAELPTPCLDKKLFYTKGLVPMKRFNTSVLNDMLKKK